MLLYQTYGLIKILEGKIIAITVPMAAHLSSQQGLDSVMFD